MKYEKKIQLTETGMITIEIYNKTEDRRVFLKFINDGILTALKIIFGDESKVAKEGLKKAHEIADNFIKSIEGLEQ